jgi:hypothetical protein
MPYSNDEQVFREVVWCTISIRSCSLRICLALNNTTGTCCLQGGAVSYAAVLANTLRAKTCVLTGEPGSSSSSSSSRRSTLHTPHVAEARGCCHQLPAPQGGWCSRLQRLDSDVQCSNSSSRAAASIIPAVSHPLCCAVLCCAVRCCAMRGDDVIVRDCFHQGDSSPNHA